MAEKNIGKITQIVGAVLDVKFTDGNLPEINSAIDVTTKEGAKLVGEVVAKRAIDKGIDVVVFDRGGYIYHGRVQELAQAAREAGLKF